MSKILENRLGDLIHDLNEIKKQILLEKFVKVDIAQKKVNIWKLLIKKVSAKWDGPSAVEEIIHQREKTWLKRLTLDSSVIISSLLKNDPRHKEALAIWESVLSGENFAIMPYSVLVEVVASIRRRTGSEKLALEVKHELLVAFFSRH